MLLEPGDDAWALAGSGEPEGVWVAVGNHSRRFYRVEPGNDLALDLGPFP